MLNLKKNSVKGISLALAIVFFVSNISYGYPVNKDALRTPMRGTERVQEGIKANRGVFPRGETAKGPMGQLRGAAKEAISQEEHLALRDWLRVNNARSEDNRRRDLERNYYGAIEIYYVAGMAEGIGDNAHYAIRDSIVYVDRDVLKSQDGILYLDQEVHKLIGIVALGKILFEPGQRVTPSFPGALYDTINWLNKTSSEEIKKWYSDFRLRNDRETILNQLVMWLEDRSKQADVKRALSSIHRRQVLEPTELVRAVSPADALFVVRGAAGEVPASAQAQGPALASGETIIQILTSESEWRKRVEAVNSLQWASVNEEVFSILLQSLKDDPHPEVMVAIAQKLIFDGKIWENKEFLRQAIDALISAADEVRNDGSLRVAAGISLLKLMEQFLAQPPEVQKDNNIRTPLRTRANVVGAIFDYYTKGEERPPVNWPDSEGIRAIARNADRIIGDFIKVADSRVSPQGPTLASGETIGRGSLWDLLLTLATLGKTTGDEITVLDIQPNRKKAEEAATWSESSVRNEFKDAVTLGILKPTGDKDARGRDLYKVLVYPRFLIEGLPMDIINMLKRGRGVRDEDEKKVKWAISEAKRAIQQRIATTQAQGPALASGETLLLPNYQLLANAVINTATAKHGVNISLAPEDIAQLLQRLPDRTQRRLLEIRWGLKSGKKVSLKNTGEELSMGERKAGRVEKIVLDRLVLASLPREYHVAQLANAIGTSPEIIPQLLEHLTPNEQKVVELRYGLHNGFHYTLDEVGQDFDVTRERVRQIEARAFRRASKTLERLVSRQAESGEGTQLASGEKIKPNVPFQAQFLPRVGVSLVSPHSVKEEPPIILPIELPTVSIEEILRMGEAELRLHEGYPYFGDAPRTEEFLRSVSTGKIHPAMTLDGDETKEPMTEKGFRTSLELALKLGLLEQRGEEGYVYTLLAKKLTPDVRRKLPKDIQQQLEDSTNLTESDIRDIRAAIDSVIPPLATPGPTELASGETIKIRGIRDENVKHETLMAKSGIENPQAFLEVIKGLIESKDAISITVLAMDDDELDRLIGKIGQEEVNRLKEIGVEFPVLNKDEQAVYLDTKAIFPDDIRLVNGIEVFTVNNRAVIEAIKGAV